MLEALASILEALITGAKSLADRKQSIAREEQQVALLAAHYCFVGIADTGETLLELAGPQPLKKLEAMNVNELREFHVLAQRYMALQLGRLKRLDILLNGQEVVDLLAPDLRRQIRKAIGGKSEGLTVVGASLFFYFVFNTDPRGDSGKPESIQRTGRLIMSMYPEVEEGVIAVEPARAYLSDLRRQALVYGEVVKQLIPAGDLLTITKRASELAEGTPDV